MKILYVKLKNFASIYTAMGLNEIEIDFSKSKNNVVLLVGENGSGKTSILSSLHPFPYYGSMDPRNAASIIRDDMDGFKEIHIKYNDDVYKIQHHYKRNSKGLLVLKSFIQKNDEELNPNGNVTSFNEIIKEELSLELDFLRLLRLGSNVTNLIDMKAHERKTFTSYLLSDINKYNALYKKVNDDNRILRSMIKTVSDKLIKLNVVDKSVLISDIDSTEKRLSELNILKDNTQQMLGNVEGRISTLLPEGKIINDIIFEINELKHSINNEESTISSTEKAINKLCIILVYSIEKELEIVSKEINNKENELNVNTNMVLFFKEQLSSLYNKENELKMILKNTVSDEAFKEMTELYAKSVAKVNTYEKEFKDYDPIYTKDNLMTILNVLKQIDDLANDTYSFDKRAVAKAIELIKDSKNSSTYISERNKEIDKDILKITANLNSAINPKNPIILFRPENCPEDKCPYLVLYDMIFSTNKSSESKSLASLQKEKEFLENVSYVTTNIDYIFMILNSYHELISKGNIPFFKIDNILKCMLAGKSIYDENYITDMISEVEDYEEYLSLKTKVKEIKTELNLMNSNTGAIESTKKEIDNISQEISILLEKITNINNINTMIENRLYDMKNHHESLLKYSEYVNKIIISKETISKLKNELDNKVKVLNSVSDLNNESTKLKKQIEMIGWEINKLNTELFNLKVKLKEFNSLTEEQNILNAKFEDINVVRESLSSTKGIPLLYMQLYLKNTKLFVNDLLKEVYADNFEIDDFVITENEFNIPYIKNNIRISDVVYASQGEKSFLSLALSFALINQSIKDYNILLLDEIDSTLDTRNRALFLNILEKQMESINSEQIFLITHNNMFENYPVDIIMTSSNKNTKYLNSNIIFSV